MVKFEFLASKQVMRQAFWLGFSAIVAGAIVFNGRSVYHAWFPGCYDCIAPAGIPFSFLTHGGFVTETHVRWTGVVADAVVIGAFASLGGLVSMRLFAGRT